MNREIPTLSDTSRTTNPQYQRPRHQDFVSNPPASGTRSSFSGPNERLEYKGGNTNREGGKNSSHSFNYRIQKALGMPSTSESSYKNPADRGSVIASRLRRQDPTKFNGLKGGGKEEADAYYWDELNSDQRRELLAAEDGNGTQEGYNYLEVYRRKLKNGQEDQGHQSNEAAAGTSQQRDTQEISKQQMHDQLINMKSIANRIAIAKHRNCIPYQESTVFLENYTIVAKYRQEKQPEKILNAYGALKILKSNYDQGNFNTWAQNCCTAMGINNIIIIKDI